MGISSLHQCGEQCFLFIIALPRECIYSLKEIWLIQVLSVLAKSKELLDLLRKVDAAYGGHMYGRPHQRSNVLLDLAPTIQEQLQVMLRFFLLIHLFFTSSSVLFVY